MRLWVLFAVAVLACGGSEAARRADAERNAQSNARSRTIANQDTQSAADQGRCDASAPGREASEYDTSGDEVPDVRKVFLQTGAPPSQRLVLICREVDLNADGVKDVVRYYTDEGDPLREEADRDFDGQMDEIAFFETGHIARMELDTNRNGIVDVKSFYENGRPARAEIDTTGRSTATDWRPDRWEYYEGGRMVRMGTDIDGDGRVDRWDRDEELRRQMEAQTQAEAAQQAAAAAADGGAPAPSPEEAPPPSPTGE